ncbi:MAG: DUF3119 family protein [Cyanothece sp. SIO2G6]|nr:DUF3119 family protein [Cyanothece sp. SIO2G6]
MQVTNLSSPPSTPSSSTVVESTELSSSYTLAIAVVLLSLPLLLLQPIVSLVVALFGVFLLFQTVAIRLVFTQSDLDVYRGDTLLRRFPYDEWENWQIYWQPVPILFYFKEVNSIHFIPMLFNAKMLREALTTHQLPQR